MGEFGQCVGKVFFLQVSFSAETLNSSQVSTAQLDACFPVMSEQCEHRHPDSRASSLAKQSTCFMRSCGQFNFVDCSVYFILHLMFGFQWCDI